MELANAFFFYLMFDMSTKEIIDVIPDASEVPIRKDSDSLSDGDGSPRRILKIIYYKRKKSCASWMVISDEETKELFSQVALSLQTLYSLYSIKDKISACFLPPDAAKPLMAQM